MKIYLSQDSHIGFGAGLNNSIFILTMHTKMSKYKPHQYKLSRRNLPIIKSKSLKHFFIGLQDAKTFHFNYLICNQIIKIITIYIRHRRSVVNNKKRALRLRNKSVVWLIELRQDIFKSLLKLMDMKPNLEKLLSVGYPSRFNSGVW